MIPWLIVDNGAPFVHQERDFYSTMWGVDSQGWAPPLQMTDLCGYSYSAITVAFLVTRSTPLPACCV